MFSFHGPDGDFRIARRRGRWYIEFNGDVLGGFRSAADAALALFECDLWPLSGPLPPTLEHWRRGPRAAVVIRAAFPRSAPPFASAAHACLIAAPDGRRRGTATGVPIRAAAGAVRRRR